MRAKFLHLADCHLGYRQYGSSERFNDFTRAFLAILKTAVDEQVDFVVLAGDLFQKRAIDALTLSHAMRGLKLLKEAGIPCIAVEGNHELAYYHNAIGWMRFLAEEELLILLSPTVEDGKLSLQPYTRREGAYVDPLPGLRVYGMPYYGSSTARVVAQVAEALATQTRDGVEYTVFIAHAGIEGEVAGASGCLTHRELAPLRPFVDYLALGHVHKPFDHGGWIYNPGSPETCSLTEASWPHRGYYLVEVDTTRPRDGEEPAHQATLHANPRRPFLRLELGADHYATPDELYQACQKLITRKQRDWAPELARQPRPVVELRLSGVLPFDRSALDASRLEAMLEEAFSPLVCLVKNATQPAEFAVAVDAKLSRRELEQQIVTDLLERDSRFQARSREWAALVLSLKEMTLTGAAPEAILEELDRRAEDLWTE